MKLLSSSSSSSSVSSTTSFDANACNSNRDTAGCIVGVIRRLLCSSNLPTYPSDNITENISVLCEHDQILKDKQRTEAPPTPGLMARLMGLESMPVTNSAHSQMTPNSIRRSRSMNSADYLQECDGMQQGKHRRVKTSLSFRELPTFLELENDEFFTLSFETGGKTKELRSKRRNSEVGFGELKQRRAERSKNKENRREDAPEIRYREDQQSRKKVSTEKENLTRRVSDKPSQLIVEKCKVKDSTNILRPNMNSTSNPCTALDVANQLKPTDHKKVNDSAKLRKTMNHSVIKKVVPESGSEESSPVSVLDFEEFVFDLEVPISEEDSRRKDSNSRRKLSPQLENYGHPSLNNSETSIIDERKSRKKDVQNMNCVSMWGEICKLAEGDIKGSNWRCRDMGKLKEFEEISAGFGVHILDQLVNELVDQLVGPLMQEF